MSTEAVIGLLVAAFGGLCALLMKHIGECTQRQREMGTLVTRLEDLHAEVNALRRRSHRHTADIGRIANKTGVELKDE